MSSNSSMTRVRKWVQQLTSTDNSLLAEVGENFEYYLNHVEELENNELSHQDLPNLKQDNKVLTHVCVFFGIDWGKEDATLYVVSDDDGTFTGLYAHAENAVRHVNGKLKNPNTVEEQLQEIPTIQTVTPQVDAQEQIDHHMSQEAEVSQKMAECLAFLREHETEFKTGELTPDAFPHFEQNIKWLIAYSALFGRLWECSHPGLWVVLDEDDRFVDLYGSPSDAKGVAAELSGARDQRVNVQDGDLPNTIVLGSELQESK